MSHTCPFCIPRKTAYIMGNTMTQRDLVHLTKCTKKYVDSTLKSAGVQPERRGTLSDRRCACCNGDHRKGKETLRGPGCTYLGERQKYPSHDRRRHTYDGQVWCRRKRGDRRADDWGIPRLMRRKQMRRAADRRYQ